jgi:predicted DNA-binding transcriptional regulator YafY
MLPTSARLLRLLSLMQARRFWSGADLVERLEVTARTLRRDVDRLRTLGYPVHSTSGVAGGYQLGAGASLPPLQLDDEEALAVSIALGTAATSNVSGVDEAALRALVKLEQVLPSRLRRRADALRATIVRLHRPGWDVSASMLAVLAGASRDHTELSFVYSDREGRETARRVQPVGLVHANSRWYLVAWDDWREDFRTFRVDRILSTAAPGARFAPRPPPEDGDLRKFVSRAIAIAPYEARASVIVLAPFEVMSKRVSPAAVQLERVDAGRCRLRAGAWSPGSILAWLLMLDVDFEIEEPAALLEHVQQFRARLGRVLAAGKQLEATDAPGNVEEARGRKPANKKPAPKRRPNARGR